MNIKKLLWTTPFLAFLIGYSLMLLVYGPQKISTPHVLGRPLTQAVRDLSDLNLNTRIVRHKEDADVPAGIVLNQSPAPGQKIKCQQSVYLVVSQQPPPKRAPSLTGKHQETIAQELSAHHIANKTYHLNSVLPCNTCIAQHPAENSTLDHENMITYISDGNTKPYVLPNFKQQPLATVRETLTLNGIKANVQHQQQTAQRHSCNNCIVVDQKPLPGTLIDMEKPPIIHLHVRT